MGCQCGPPWAAKLGKNLVELDVERLFQQSVIPDERNRSIGSKYSQELRLSLIGLKPMEGLRRRYQVNR
jgi:hypothetical protein